MKKYLCIILFLLLSFNSLYAQKISLGASLIGNFGNKYLEKNFGYGVDMNIHISNKLFLKTSLENLSTNRKYSETKKYDFSYKVISERIIYFFGKGKYKPYMGLGIGYYMINYSPNIRNIIIESSHRLHHEKINSKIGYQICTGIQFQISSYLFLDTILQYIWLSPSVKRGYMNLYSSNVPPPYDFEQCDIIKLNSLCIGISFLYKFKTNLGGKE